jgi:hypothetical protein
LNEISDFSEPFGPKPWGFSSSWGSQMISSTIYGLIHISSALNISAVQWFLLVVLMGDSLITSLPKLRSLIFFSIWLS